MPLPQPIHGHARKERVLRRGQPVGKRLHTALAEVDFRGRPRPARLDGAILLRPLWVAARQDVALVQLLFPVHLHGPEGGDRAAAATYAAAATGLVELSL